MGLYDDDGDFNDPVLRCTECQKLLFKKDLIAMGKCFCGCRKVRAIEFLSDGEMKLMHNKGIDPDFIAIFERIPEVTGA